MTSKSDKMGLRYNPMAFTEQGVSMLSSVLNSERAIQVNIQIMRTFTKLRKMLTTHKDLQKKIVAMEGKYDKQFKVVFDALRVLIEPYRKSFNSSILKSLNLVSRLFSFSAMSSASFVRGYLRLSVSLR